MVNAWQDLKEVLQNSKKGECNREEDKEKNEDKDDRDKNGEGSIAELKKVEMEVLRSTPLSASYQDMSFVYKYY